VDETTAKPYPGPIGFETFGYLHGQLPRRGEHEIAHFTSVSFAVLPVEPVEDRQGEGSGFPRAGLRDGEKILASENRWDALGLNRRRVNVAFALEGFLEARCEWQIPEG